MRERVYSMSWLFLTMFINIVLKDWGQIHWLFASRLLLYPFPGECVYLNEKGRVKCMKRVKGFWSTLLLFLVTNSIKSRLFLKNPSRLHEYRTVFKDKSTLSVDSQKGQVGSYCEEIFPNYFEYKLWREVIMVGGPMSWPQLLWGQQLPDRSWTSKFL